MKPEAASAEPGGAFPPPPATVVTVKRPSLARRLAESLVRNRIRFVLIALVSAFVAVAFWDSIMVAKKPGEHGVYWSRFFGGTSNRVLGEGTHMKFPWDEIVIYDIRMREISGKTVLLSKDGMEMNIEWSVRFHPRADRLPQLHSLIGPNYPNTVVVPEVVGSLRKIIGNYTAEQIYARDEDSLLHEIADWAIKRLEQYPLQVDNVLILRLDLPVEMAKSIVDKLIFEQNLLAYRYRNEAEEQEKRRKQIEAEGIRDFEAISRVSALRWKGLDVTRDIAKSNNSKIVIMGNSDGGLPLLLNADAASAAPAAPAPPGPDAAKSAAPAALAPNAPIGDRDQPRVAGTPLLPGTTIYGGATPDGAGPLPPPSARQVNPQAPIPLPPRR